MAKQDEKEKQGRGDKPAEIKFVMMRRITDGDGPHPIHPNEVENYKRGEWVVVEEQQ